jgi:[acyl-carrier-protein] S-malonyltransferase
MADLAYIFPGQGSHFVGMGKDLYDAVRAARRVYDQADAALGFAFSDLCFNGPAEALTDTVNQQPALLTTSMAILAALRDAGKERQAPAYVAGHSLGEYSALVAAGALEFADAVRLVRERGRLMKAAGDETPGAMAAVLNMDDSVLESVCAEASRQTGGPGVVCANYNSPGQVVVSGERSALEAASALAKERGARRVIPLAVSIASHSPLMAGAAREFSRYVQATPFSTAKIPVVANVTGRPIFTAEEIRRELVDQLTNPVRWTASVQYMVGQGVGVFWEIGPKDVLAGLVRRIAEGVEAVSIGTAEAVQRLA